MNRQVPGFSATDMIAELQRNGFMLLGHYEIQNVCAYLPNEPSYDPQYFAEFEQLQHRLTNVYPYYSLTWMFRVIVRKS
jgi:hypothetical protein